MTRSRATTDHDEIRQWAEERGGKPAAVRATGGEDVVGMIRIEFPGSGGKDKLEPISWDEWFEQFDDSNLAMILEDETAKGQKSHSGQLVSRTSMAAGEEAGEPTAEEADAEAGQAEEAGKGSRTPRPRTSTSKREATSKRGQASKRGPTSKRSPAGKRGQAAKSASKSRRARGRARR